MKVKFLPQDIEVDIKPGQSVLNVAQDNGVHIQSVCKGIPSCAECRVQVIEGADNVLPPMPEELNLIGTAHFVDQRRLSCQMRCFGSVVVNLEEQVAKEQVSAKRPQGKAHKEEADSSARMGNILEDNVAVDLEITEEERREAEAAMAEKEARDKQRQQQQQSKKKKKSKNKNRGGKKKSSAKKAEPQSGESKNKNKNRNRSRNRNKKKAAASGPKTD